MTMTKQTIFVLLALALVACQTTPPPQAKRAPANLEEAFSTCQEGDGEVLARLLEHGQVIETVPLEWAAWYNKGWAFEGVSPFGQTLFRLNYQQGDGKFLGSGAIANLPPLSTNDKGFIVVDRRWVGIKPQEIPCFLDGKIPSDWLKRIVKWEPSAHELVFTSMEANRAMYVRMEVDEQNTINYCGRIIWKYYWGMISRELKVCSTNFVTTVSGYQDFRLELERQNDL